MRIALERMNSFRELSGWSLAKTAYQSLSGIEVLIPRVVSGRALEEGGAQYISRAALHFRSRQGCRIVEQTITAICRRKGFIVKYVLYTDKLKESYMDVRWRQK